MDYKETINYLFHLLPMYQRQGAPAMKKDLTNIIKLCDGLGNPHASFKSIHIGGTNGKGTTSHMISSILQESGLKVGLYTSPHYRDFRERIKVNGDYITEDYVVQFVKNQQEAIDLIRPSFFEMTVAMAFQYFKECKVDIAVIEVGLGGRLDSTNIVTPILSVITNIGLDHQQFLGDTIPEIAGEKAGIIKQNVPVVIGEYHPESAPTFISKAESRNSKISFASEEWNVVEIKKGTFNFSSDDQEIQIQPDVISPFTTINIATVLEAVHALDMDIEMSHIIKGIENFKTTINYIGRWQLIDNQPDTIADSGHNEHALSKSIAHLEGLKYRQIHFVLGFVKDKDIAKILDLFPQEALYYFAKPNIVRGASTEEYISILKRKNLNYETYLTVTAALTAARRTAASSDLIFVGGSSFVVAEVI